MPVTIYEHANFEGRSQVLPKGQYDTALGQISIGNDTLSSVKVPNALVARLYEHSLFRGEFIDIRANTRPSLCPGTIESLPYSFMTKAKNLPSNRMVQWLASIVSMPRAAAGLACTLIAR
jgi:hypothetical protein